MAAFPAPLDNLISYVRDLQPEGGPLEHLSDAVLTAEELSDQSDALIGHFVDQARASGASWSQIGTAMGVTKQAAQKRFTVRDEPLVPDGKTFSRFTPRARAAVAAAGALALATGSDAAGPGHLAAGAVADPGGLAALVVRRLGVGDEPLLGALGTPAAVPGADPDPAALRELRWTDEARDAFQQALRAALRLGHNYIGTEHLLLGVTAGEGPVARALAGIGLRTDLVEGAVAVEIAEVTLRLRQEAAGSGT